MGRHLKPIFLAILILAIFSFASCSTFKKAENTSTKKTSQEAKKEDLGRQPSGKPVLLFDLGHREVFSPTDSGMRGMKKAVQIFQEKGFSVQTNEETFEKKDVFKGVNTVFIAGPMSELNKKELDLLYEFVKNGGNLLITVHVNFFAQGLLDKFGFLITQSPLSQEKNAFHNTYKDFFATQIIEHPITKEIKSIGFMGAYGIKAKGKNHNELVFSDDSAWADLNGNDLYDNSDIRGRFCLVGASEVGQGKVVVIGDDAVFSNMLLAYEGNEKLLKNISEWFIGMRGEGSI